MKLYHGTTEKIARLALIEGLRPREETGSKGNWEHSIDSALNRVYLSAAYAGYFAYCAAGVDEKWGIVEVDTELLEPDKFYPDEDFMEQASRAQEVPKWVEEDPDDPMGDPYEELRAANALPDKDRMKARTEYFRNNIWFYAHLWRDSVEHLGNCCYLGEIPPEAITRVSVFDPTSNMGIQMSVDPSITLLNYRVCQNKYKAITRWLAGYEDVTVDDITMLFAGEDERVEEAREYWRTEVIPNRSGLEVIRGPGDKNESYSSPSSRT